MSDSDSLAIVVVTKYPAAGRVKTRLLPELTGEQAAAVHRLFLLHLVGRLAGMGLGRAVVCHDPADAEGALRDLLAGDRDISYLPQAGGDLGNRLAVAFDALQPTYPRVLFLGTDSPDVADGHLRGATELTKGAAVTLGLTEDGGYWCLGLRRGVDAHRLLREIPWSSGGEAAATLQRAGELGYTVGSAGAWPDVDRASDLDRMVARLTESSDAGDRRLLSDLRAILRSKAKS